MKPYQPTLEQQFQLNQKCRTEQHRNFQIAQDDAPTFPGWLAVVAVLVSVIIALGVK
mgnify:FL=1